MISILHISTAKSWRGGENQIAQLLLGVRKNNEHQHLICLKKSPLHLFCKENEINYTTINGRFLGFFRWIFEIYKQIKKNNVSVIHLHDSKAQTLAVLTSILGILNIPMVLSRKVIFPIKNNFVTNFKYNYFLIKVVICVSNSVKNVVESRFPTKNLVVIMDCVDTLIKSDSTYFKEKFNFRHKDIIISYVAALTDEKDHITFLKTAKLIHKKIKTAKFLIIGEGKNLNKLVSLSKELSINKVVVFTGFIENVNRYLSGIDLCLFTSKEEGLGSTVLEFFLAKTPVVSTNAGGLKDIVIANETGLICNICDEICLSKQVFEMLKNKNLRSNCIKNAYEYVISEHSLDKFTEKHIQIYKSI